MSKLEYSKVPLVHRKFTKAWAKKFIDTKTTPNFSCFESMLEYIESLQDEIDILNEKLF